MILKVPIGEHETGEVEYGPASMSELEQIAEGECQCSGEGDIVTYTCEAHRARAELIERRVIEREAEAAQKEPPDDDITF